MPKWARRRTNIAGSLTIAAAIAAAIAALIDTDPATNPDWTIILAAITAGAGLLAARDKHADPPPAPPKKKGAQGSTRSPERRKSR